MARNCSEYWPDHFFCDVDKCIINKNVNSNCTVFPNFICEGDRYIIKNIPCLYCWQVAESNLRCYFRDQCKPDPRPQPGKCSVLPSIECLGNRTFGMQQYCPTTSGYSWELAVFLSFFFGGFGADRFYLGHTMTGFFKLLSLGGFGVWSSIDIILLISKVMKPKDGSLYEGYLYNGTYVKK